MTARAELPSVAKLAGDRVCVTSAGVATRAFDPYAAFAEVRAGGVAIVIAGSGAAIRALAQRVLEGPAEVPAPRPATAAEHAIWALFVAAALNDVGVTADVWPLPEVARTALERDLVDRARPTSVDLEARGHDDDRKTSPMPAVRLADAGRVAPASGPASGPASVGGMWLSGREVAPIEIVVDAGGIPLTVIAWCPIELVTRVPPARGRDWAFDLPIVVARCAIDRPAARALAARDVVVVERELSLELGDGTIGLVAGPDGVTATVATGYVRRDMALPDPQLELTVRLGTTRLGLRRLNDLAVGEVIALGRPLSGPYEIHVGGRKIGEGELVDIDGEVGVRIVSLIEE